MNSAISPELPLARYRFTFRARDDVRLPEYAGSLLRGQFGASLRKTVCVTGAKQCTGCLLYRTCAYPAIFETPAPETHALQKFSRVPNPYVIEPPPFGTREVPAGQSDSFNIVLFGRALAQLPLVIFAFQRALAGGLGKERAIAALEMVEWERDYSYEQVWDAESGSLREHAPGLAVPAFASTGEATLHITTPMRLQRQGRPLRAHELAPRTLVTALLRRISLLFELHAGQPGVINDPRALAMRAESLEDDRALRWVDWTRYSSRQRQTMTLGGVVGTWSLRGDVAPLLPWLWLGQWLHVGKEAVMGMGGYRLELS